MENYVFSRVDPKIVNKFIEQKMKKTLRHLNILLNSALITLSISESIAKWVDNEKENNKTSNSLSKYSDTIVDEEYEQLLIKSEKENDAINQLSSDNSKLRVKITKVQNRWIKLRIIKNNLLHQEYCKRAKKQYRVKAKRTNNMSKTVSTTAIPKAKTILSV